MAAGHVSEYALFKQKQRNKKVPLFKDAVSHRLGHRASHGFRTMPPRKTQVFFSPRYLTFFPVDSFDFALTLLSKSIFPDKLQSRLHGRQIQPC